LTENLKLLREKEMWPDVSDVLYRRLASPSAEQLAVIGRGRFVVVGKEKGHYF
jgi:hypothetical protein